MNSGTRDGRVTSELGLPDTNGILRQPWVEPERTSTGAADRGPRCAVVIGPFTYTALPMRVVFGPGSLADLPDEVAALGLTRVLVLCSPEQQDTGEQVATALGEKAAGVLAEADIPRIAALAVANPYANPRPVTKEGVTALLEAAWSGQPPRT